MNIPLEAAANPTARRSWRSRSRTLLRALDLRQWLSQISMHLNHLGDLFSRIAGPSPYIQCLIPRPGAGPENLGAKKFPLTLT